LYFFSPSAWSNSRTTGSDSPQSTHGCCCRYSNTSRAFLFAISRCRSRLRRLYSSPPIAYVWASITFLHCLQWTWGPPLRFVDLWNSSSGFWVLHLGQYFTPNYNNRYRTLLESSIPITGRGER